MSQRNPPSFGAILPACVTPASPPALPVATAVQLSNKGNPEALREWFNNGADGQIAWGSHGDFEACVAIAGKYMDNPEGY